MTRARLSSRTTSAASIASHRRGAAQRCPARRHSPDALATRFPAARAASLIASARARASARGARPAPSARAPSPPPPRASSPAAERPRRIRPRVRSREPPRSPPRPSPRAPPRPKRRTRGGRRRPRARPRSTAPRRARSTWRRSGSDRSRPPRSDPSTRDDPPASKPTASASSSPTERCSFSAHRPRRTPSSSTSSPVSGGSLTALLRRRHARGRFLPPPPPRVRCASVPAALAITSASAVAHEARRDVRDASGGRCHRRAPRDDAVLIVESAGAGRTPSARGAATSTRCRATRSSPPLFYGDPDRRPRRTNLRDAAMAQRKALARVLNEHVRPAGPRELFRALRETPRLVVDEEASEPSKKSREKKRTRQKSRRDLAGWFCHARRRFDHRGGVREHRVRRVLVEGARRGGGRGGFARCG